MARTVALPALPARLFDVVRAAGVAAVLLWLAVFVASPVAAVIVRAALGPGAAWPWGLAASTLAVVLASTLATIVPAALIGLTLTRVNVPGRELVWRTVRLGALIPPFMAPLALVVLAGGSRSAFGLTAIVVGQALGFFSPAVVLVVRVLAAVPIELEQAAELLGARRATVMWRVTFGLAAPDLLAVVLIVLGLCLADVATPRLLGGDARVLATVIVDAAAAGGAAAAALLLAALGAAAALAAGAWRYAGVAAREPLVLPRLERPASAALRWTLGVAVWGVTAMLAVSWVVVPLSSLRGWPSFATTAIAGAIRNSVLVGLGAAVAGTALALATAWIAERGPATWGRAVRGLARMPLAIPGLVAGVGYLLMFGPPPAMLAGGLPLLIVLVACWELPVVSRAAAEVLVRSDASAEDAAVSLGADGLTTLTRVVAPMLRPVAGWIFGDLLAAGLLAIGPVIVLTGPGRDLGAPTILTLAAGGATAAACAVATALLVLAGGAALLGRTMAGRRFGCTWLA